MEHILHVACFILLIVPMSHLESLNKTLHRHRRGLPIVFPPTAPTRTQWIVGIGIPLEDLVYGAMTTGYVLKAEYFLPSTAQQLRTKTTLDIAGRRRRSYNASSTLFEKHFVDEEDLRNPHQHSTFDEMIQNSKKVLSSYRWSVYKGLEGLANRLGLSGRSCILKSICETAETPFHYKNGMMGELVHILLTPSSSADDLSEHADNEYYQAESYGRSGANCQRIFRDCRKSLLEHFSNIHMLAKDLSMLLELLPKDCHRLLNAIPDHSTSFNVHSVAPKLLDAMIFELK